MNISHKINGKQTYKNLSNIPVPKDILQKLMRDEQITINYPIGIRIASLRESYNNNYENWINLDEKYKEMVKSIPRLIESQQGRKNKKRYKII